MRKRGHSLISYRGSVKMLFWLSIFFTSCVKPHNEERFKAVETDLCTDNVLNNGEYFTDCGGPCAPCPTASPFVSFKIDSTWKPKNPGTPSMNSDYVDIVMSGGLLNVVAVDTFNTSSDNILIHFTIEKSWGPGVHIANKMTGDEHLYTNPPGSPPGFVYLENGGVISITNYDAVNELISGEFKFNSKPDEGSGYRVVIYNGVFRDFPLK